MGFLQLFGVQAEMLADFLVAGDARHLLGKLFAGRGHVRPEF